ncbi:DUF4391 domain-containing protein [Crocinitomicaceae bacterium CZZ-1]|uniref:DUF4391 domain-containing protein n=1 Tax=Taishania pollutisoli TaxID=2766479 RepID=A0A8J6PC53_9FLAO|nr:DUF4391 domain-containing protein [Taishania pollutisoli]
MEKKLTKAFFTKNFDLSSSEKKFLTNDILSMEWLGNIKPVNSNVSTYQTATYSFEEIQVFTVLIPNNQISKLAQKAIQLIQKYIPYQAVVIAEDEFEFVIGLCDKRINQADKSKRTIEQHYFSPVLSKLFKNELQTGLYDALAFEKLDKTNLETVYKSYVQALANYQTALLTGTFSKRSGVRTEKDMELLATMDRLEAEIASLKVAVKKENNLNEQVKLNVTINKRRQEIETIKKQLSEE